MLFSKRRATLLVVVAFLFCSILSVSPAPAYAEEPENLAHWKPTAASFIWSQGMSVMNVDGSDAYWRNTSWDQNDFISIQIDLEEPKSFNTIKVIYAWNEHMLGDPSLYVTDDPSILKWVEKPFDKPTDARQANFTQEAYDYLKDKNYILENYTRDDLANWKKVDVQVSRTKEEAVLTFDTVTARYVNLMMDYNRMDPYYVGLREIEIYNIPQAGSSAEPAPAKPAAPAAEPAAEAPAATSVSRAEFTSLVAKALGLAPENETGFTDIAATDAFGQDVGAAFKAGLVSGVGDGKFEPARAIKREEAAVILAGALKYKNKAAEADNSALNAFGDKDSISSWAVDKVAQVVKAGIMGGVDASTFGPANGISSEEANAIINNFNSYVAAAPGAPAAEAPAKVDGPNLALGKTATASNSNSKAQPGNALDGDLETVWRTNGPSDKNNFMQYTVDLGAATTFNKIVLNKLYNPQKYKPGTGKVEISNDGQTWTQIATMDTFEDVVTITFDDVTARYVRVYADKAEDPDPTIGFHEFELYHAQ